MYLGVHKSHTLIIKKEDEGEEVEEVIKNTEEFEKKFLG